jgi:hypothetical protein
MSIESILVRFWKSLPDSAVQVGRNGAMKMSKRIRTWELRDERVMSIRKCDCSKAHVATAHRRKTNIPLAHFTFSPISSSPSQTPPLRSRTDE